METQALNRVVAVASLMIMFPMFLPFHFVVSVLPSMMAILYPMIRTENWSSDSLEIIANCILGFVVSAYYTREACISNICRLHSSQTAQEQWKEMLRTLPVGVIIVSRIEEKCLFKNPAVLTLLGIDHILGSSPEEKIEDEQTNEQNLNSIIQDFLQHSQIKKIGDHNEQTTEFIQFKDFLSHCEHDEQINYFLEVNSKLIELRVSSITFDELAAQLVSFIDCSPVQKIEKLQSENRYKTLLFSTISHELRTPINAVLNSVELIKNFVPPEKQRFVKIAEDSCNLILYHVNDFTDYGKLNQQNIVLNIQPVGIRDLVEFCMELVRFNAEQKGLQLTLEVAPRSRHSLAVDERRLKQLVLNLLNNAVKFTIYGAVKVSLLHQVVSECNSYYAIKVKDSGMGIKPEDVSKLGNEFTMLKSHTAINPNGTGLGLYMCKKLLGLMKGSLQIESEWGQGSTFTILLPLDDPSTDCRLDSDFSDEVNSSFAPIMDHIEVLPPLSTSKKVLLVDDCSTNLFVMEGLLEKFGLACEKSTDGKNAIEKIRSYWSMSKKGYDLILMDINMPIMGGFEAGRIIKRMIAKKEAPVAPIIALSGDNPEEMPQKKVKESFDFVMMKPMSASMLKKVLLQYMLLQNSS